MDKLGPTWRTVLPDVLAEAAGRHGVVVDLRSPSYQAVGMPDGLADRTVTVRVMRERDGSGLIGDVIPKRTRGLLARHLLESSDDPEHPAGLATVVGGSLAGGARLAAPGRPAVDAHGRRARLSATGASGG